MKIISSQRYLDEETVEEKKAHFNNGGEPEIRIAKIGEDTNGEPVYVLIDGHHAMAAVRELGLTDFSYEDIQPVDAGFAEDDTMQDVLEKMYMDSDYYWVTGENAGVDITEEEWGILGV